MQKTPAHSDHKIAWFRPFLVFLVTEEFSYKSSSEFYCKLAVAIFVPHCYLVLGIELSILFRIQFQMCTLFVTIDFCDNGENLTAA